MQRDQTLCVRAQRAPAINAAGFISPKQMVCLWDTDEHLRICELRIVSRQDRYNHLSHLPYSDGALCADWMKRPLRKPLGIYARLATVYGFRSREMHLHVLRQFQQISGQQWAADWAREIGGGR